MNKVAVVLGVAAVATLAGCKDPDIVKGNAGAQSEVKQVPTEDVAKPAPAPEKTAAPKQEKAPAKPTCKCPPGTKHTSPCKCGAPDCQCIVEVKPVKPAEPEFTVYYVQNGDYLAKISKKYNVTINSIKRLNNLKSDVIHVGQKLKLPGKLDVPPAPVATTDKGSTTKKGYTSYKGATKEYVVKTGDTLGAIAYGNGLNIRQLKELNGLTSDVLKVGQKLKIPADGKGTPVETQKINEKQSKVAPAGVIAPAPAAPVEEPAPVVEAPESVVEEPAPAEEPATSTYTVQEGDDMTGVSIRFCVSAAAIRELNNLPEDAQLTVGQVIKLPADAQQ